MHFFQPVDGHFGELFLAELRKNEFRKYRELRMLVAYAKHSGVARLAKDLETFVKRGGKVVAMIGVDQAHTTREALELLVHIGCEVYVYYDEAESRTFHPKIFSLQGKRNWLAVGSNNLTAGGLFLNYEAAIVRKWKSEDVGVGNALKALDQWCDPGHDANKGLIRSVGLADIEELADQGYLLTEAQSRQLSNRSRARQRALGEEQAKPRKALFSRSKPPALPEVPKEYRLPKTEGSAEGEPPVVTPPPSGIGVGPAPAPAPTLHPVQAIEEGFWKRLSNWDANPSSSPGQIVIPKRFVELFPELGAQTALNEQGRQADTFLSVHFLAITGQITLADDARLIEYTPGKKHKRKNIEFRFTFHDKEISKQLSAGDVLEFRRTEGKDPWFIITHILAKDVKADGNFGLI